MSELSSVSNGYNKNREEIFDNSGYITTNKNGSSMHTSTPKINAQDIFASEISIVTQADSSLPTTSVSMLSICSSSTPKQPRKREAAQCSTTPTTSKPSTSAVKPRKQRKINQNAQTSMTTPTTLVSQPPLSMSCPTILANTVTFPIITVPHKTENAMLPIQTIPKQTMRRLTITPPQPLTSTSKQIPSQVMPIVRTSKSMSESTVIPTIIVPPLTYRVLMAVPMPKICTVPSKFVLPQPSISTSTSSITRKHRAPEGSPASTTSQLSITQSMSLERITNQIAHMSTTTPTKLVSQEQSSMTFPTILTSTATPISVLQQTGNVLLPITTTPNRATMSPSASISKQTPSKVMPIASTSKTKKPKIDKLPFTKTSFEEHSRSFEKRRKTKKTERIHNFRLFRIENEFLYGYVKIYRLRFQYSFRKSIRTLERSKKNKPVGQKFIRKRSSSWLMNSPPHNVDRTMDPRIIELRKRFLKIQKRSAFDPNNRAIVSALLNKYMRTMKRTRKSRARNFMARILHYAPNRIDLRYRFIKKLLPNMIIQKLTVRKKKESRKNDMKKKRH